MYFLSHSTCSIACQFRTKLNSSLFNNVTGLCRGGGGTDLERGYGDVRPWRPPFHASPVVCKGPISSKRVSSQDPLLRKFGHFSFYSLNFNPNFSSQAPIFGNFQLKKAPFFRSKYQFASPTLRKSGPHIPPWKKVECHLHPNPVPPLCMQCMYMTWITKNMSLGIFTLC